ncbi:hypothetical protein GCM10009681_22040 [Luedemannella helvata]|uniref:Tetratricopeptide repeat protein n=1 Tax=Luedemannella helvata TaxID=349315 RepID=A0ABP4WB64_9ACTN
MPAMGRARVDTSVAAIEAARAFSDPYEKALTAMATWAVTGDRPLWLLNGGAGMGKTSFAGQMAERVTAHGVQVGWAPPGRAVQAVQAVVASGRPGVVIVDDAETRADIGDLLALVAGGGQPLPVRVVIVAREFGAWWTRQLNRLTRQEQDALAARRTMIGKRGEAGPARLDLVLRTDSQRAESSPLATLTSADPVSGAVLLRMAALVVALPTRVGQLKPLALRAAVRDLFSDEEGYWRRAANEVSQTGAGQPALRSALACSAVARVDGIADAATVLRRVPMLAVSAADRLARLAVWWHGLYDRLGSGSPARSPRLPGWLADQVPQPGAVDSSGLSWTVAAFETERKVTETLAELTRDVHRDIWPRRVPGLDDDQPDQSELARNLERSVSAKAPVDEALAWLTQESDLGDDDMAALSEAMFQPTKSLPRTAVVLLNRLLDGDNTAHDQAALQLELGARLSELGMWDDARQVTEEAVARLRVMVDLDRAAYLSDLATGVLNLGSCAAQLGRHDEALDITYEAVSLYRELASTRRDEHLHSLGRALTNLSSCLSRVGRRPAALGAAGQAVGIYKELAANNPRAYSRELAIAEHNWNVCRDALGQPVAGRQPEPPARTAPPGSTGASPFIPSQYSAPRIEERPAIGPPPVS